jgi:signal transduction histidine kinase
LATISSPTEPISDCDKILGSGLHLLSLINELLDLAKIEAGKMEIVQQEFHVQDLVHTIVATITPLAEKNGNTFSLSYETPHDLIVSDATRIKQIFMNLLGNACKFTTNGTITLRITTTDVDDRLWYSFQVSDNGIGIPQEKMRSIFEAFEQADSSITQNYGGTGLGLAITKRFCQLLGGTISLQSNMGEGSTFTVLLPYSPAQSSYGDPAMSDRKAS